MDKQNQLLILLSLTIIAAGCINQDTVSEGPEAVETQELSVTPAEIREGDASRVVLETENVGNLPAEIQVEDEGNNILVDRCRDIFDLEEFSHTAPPGSEISENHYELEQGDGVRMDWTLEQTGTVPLYDLTCDLSFRVPFNYSVQAFQQIEVREDESVDGAQSLESRSSSGPMQLSIDTVPGTLQTPGLYVQDQDRTITIGVQFSNQEGEEGYDTGIVGVDHDSMDIDVPEEMMPEDQDLEDVCSAALEQGINMHGGESETITCDLEVPEQLDGPAEIFDISVEADYEYTRNIGSRTIEVSQRG